MRGALSRGPLKIPMGGALSGRSVRSGTGIPSAGFQSGRRLILDLAPSSVGPRRFARLPRRYLVRALARPWEQRGALSYGFHRANDCWMRAPRGAADALSAKCWETRENENGGMKKGGTKEHTTQQIHVLKRNFKVHSPLFHSPERPPTKRRATRWPRSFPRLNAASFVLTIFLLEIPESRFREEEITNTYWRPLGTTY